MSQVLSTALSIPIDQGLQDPMLELMEFLLGSIPLISRVVKTVFRLRPLPQYQSTFDIVLVFSTCPISFNS